MKQKTPQIPKTPQERAGMYMINSNIELKKLNLIARPVIHFPKRRNVSLLSRIAMWVLRKQGAILDTQFFERK